MKIPHFYKRFPSTDSTLDHLLAFTIKFSKKSAQCTNKNLILDEQSQIEDALQQYFSNIGNHANNMQDVDNFKDNVRKKVAKLDENLFP
jgi:hypothetical protein